MSHHLRSAVILSAFVFVPTSALAEDPANLVATGRSDTRLYLQWHANGNEAFTVDYLGPEHFGGRQPTCGDFPQHDSILEATSDAVVVEHLEPSTWYSIHVHAIDPVTHLVTGSPTNLVLVKTGALGSGFEALAAGSTDYTICGAGGGGDGGGGGGDDDGCAQVTFTLLPGSEALAEVQVTVVDPPTGEELASFILPVATALSIPAGSFHFRFGAPAGYEVTPVQRGLSVACGDDTVVRLRFRHAPPGRR